MPLFSSSRKFFFSIILNVQMSAWNFFCQCWKTLSTLKSNFPQKFRSLKWKSKIRANYLFMGLSWVRSISLPLTLGWSRIRSFCVFVLQTVIKRPEGNLIDLNWSLLRWPPRSNQVIVVLQGALVVVLELTTFLRCIF